MHTQHGSAPAVTAVLGCNVDVAVDTLMSLAPQIQAGKVQGLAIAGKERSLLIPDVPIAAEAGLQGLEASGWFGLVLPANAPAEVVQRLNQEVGKIAQLLETAERFAQNGIVAKHSSPEQF
jgi:tripartite-type tricarboxylate transporter receptor subunit TctC